MKTKIIRKARELGATLLVTLFICTVLGTSALGYLMLVQQQGELNTRSQAWNLTIALVEAGVEEALQQMNDNFDNLASGSWAPYGSGGYVCDRTLPGGSYRAFIFLTNGYSSPVIVATATVDMKQWAKGPVHSLFAAVGVTGDASYVTRTVRVVCYRGSDFPNAIVAKEKITMNGNNVKVDSFRSCDWPDRKYKPERAKSKGDVASNGSLIDAGNANIYGKVSTGPGGKVQVGNNGGVGSYEWQATHKGIQPGWVSDTSNFIFKETDLPYASGPTPTGGTEVTASYSSGSTVVTNLSFPNPPPITGVKTNTSWATVSSMPDNPPPGLKAITNSVTTTSVPSPVPAGTTTNTISVTGNYPAPGTYVGNIVTNWNGGSGKIKNYSYNQISGYTYPVVSYQYPVTSYTYSMTTTNVTYTTNYYDHILHSGEYYATSLSGKILVKGDATLVLPNGLNIGNGDEIKILDIAKLTIYSGGTSVKLAGNKVLNEGGYAGNFILYCAPSVTSFDLSGNAQFTGIIYAPNAAVKLNGGGNDTLDLVGALIAKSITLNGHFNVHYDECLTDDPSNSLFVIKSWDEIY